MRCASWLRNRPCIEMDETPFFAFGRTLNWVFQGRIIGAALLEVIRRRTPDLHLFEGTRVSRQRRPRVSESAEPHPNAGHQQSKHHAKDSGLRRSQGSFICPSLFKQSSRICLLVAVVLIIQLMPLSSQGKERPLCSTALMSQP